jgi:hypothetical protein
MVSLVASSGTYGMAVLWFDPEDGVKDPHFAGGIELKPPH